MIRHSFLLRAELPMLFCYEWRGEMEEVWNLICELS